MNKLLDLFEKILIAYLGFVAVYTLIFNRTFFWTVSAVIWLVLVAFILWKKIKKRKRK